MNVECDLGFGFNDILKAYNHIVVTCSSWYNKEQKHKVFKSHSIAQLWAGQAGLVYFSYIPSPEQMWHKVFFKVDRSVGPLSRHAQHYQKTSKAPPTLYSKGRLGH